jgi:monoamine oxidase
MLREAHAACAESADTGVPIDEITAIRAERSSTRREFLRQAGTMAATVIAAGATSRLAFAGNAPRIVIVGGGLAGLRCAHKLWTRHGIASTVYEWDDHFGGRVQTLRDFFANGQIVEQHGEFISSEHSSMRALAARFGLTLENAESGSGPNAYWFNGGYYTQAKLNHDWQNFAWQTFYRAVHSAPFPTLYNQYGKTAYQWDHMSVVDWINRYLPGGMSAPFGQLCYENVVGEYGGPPESQSALNLIYVLGYDDSSQSGWQPRRFPVLSGTDELYHVHGGNDQIIQGVLNELPAGSTLTGQQLVALRQNSDGSLTCTFSTGTSTYEVPADHVVLAIPFTTLRQVDLSKAGLSPLKMRAIRDLQLGTNAKIQMQFASRVWSKEGFSGTVYASNGAAVAWECTNYQQGETGIIIDFPGGGQVPELIAKYGITQDEAVAPAALVTGTLAAFEPIFPGITAAYNGLAYAGIGLVDPHLLGAYSQYSLGQYTSFAGYEGAQEGNIHFAGEHTSVTFQGFMEGAVESGERVANEITG